MHLVSVGGCARHGVLPGPEMEAGQRPGLGVCDSERVGPGRVSLQAERQGGAVGHGHC